jgi:hypothetical protein
MELGGQNICSTTFAPHVWHLRGKLGANLPHLPHLPHHPNRPQVVYQAPGEEVLSFLIRLVSDALRGRVLLTSCKKYVPCYHISVYAPKVLLTISLLTWLAGDFEKRSETVLGAM